MATAIPHHRHQSSMERLINFNLRPSLGILERERAKHRLHSIIKNVETSNDSIIQGYSRPLLVQYTYEYSLSDRSKDTFLRAFFDTMPVTLDSDSDIDFSDTVLEEQIRTAFTGFADYLFDNFFLPLMASSQTTPQPSPITHSAVQRALGGEQEFSGTPDRLSSLRGICLTRDRHRCVISRKFDSREAENRFHLEGDMARDDDGVFLHTQRLFARLEVAHILPHSLVHTEKGGQLEHSKQVALEILNMFDHNAAYLIEGEEVDRPRNAITLTHDLHDWFGRFKIFFEPVPDQPPHTYRVGSYVRPNMLPDLALPLTRKLYITENRTIDPPLPRLLAIHRAIARILHLSGAGEYIDQILRDLGEIGVRVDGSTELGHFVKLRLDGWITGVA
ncbi:hypothetical protein I7I48_10498 [Histoplasma ohiense]|nr:hypothetical protein I7I48_10498 [Histoplasma ohiense (nom. inval.)]